MSKRIEFDLKLAKKGSPFYFTGAEDIECYYVGTLPNKMIVYWWINDNKEYAIGVTQTNHEALFMKPAEKYAVVFEDYTFDSPKEADKFMEELKKVNPDMRDAAVVKITD